jgi:hypothetical protein
MSTVLRYIFNRYATKHSHDNLQDIRDSILLHQSYAVSQYYYISAQLLVLLSMLKRERAEESVGLYSVLYLKKWVVFTCSSPPENTSFYILWTKDTVLLGLPYLK